LNKNLVDGEASTTVEKHILTLNRQRGYAVVEDVGVEKPKFIGGKPPNPQKGKPKKYKKRKITNTNTKKIRKPKKD
jgi:hypothetical protein